MYVEWPTERFILATTDKHRLLRCYVNKMFPSVVIYGNAVVPGFQKYDRVDSEKEYYRESWVVLDRDSKSHIVNIWRINGRWHVINCPKISDVPLPGYEKVDLMRKSAIVVIEHSQVGDRPLCVWPDVQSAKNAYCIVTSEGDMHYDVDGRIYSFHPVKWNLP